MIGLAAVLLLIGLAAAIFSTASKERPFTVAGGARPDVVANMAAGNQALPQDSATSEPLHELGVAPGASSDDATQNGAAPASPKNRQVLSRVISRRARERRGNPGESCADGELAWPRTAISCRTHREQIEFRR